MLSGAHHYAQDRFTFDTYHVTDAQVSSGFGPLTALSIGTVTLELIRGPNDPRSYTLVLKDVLHIRTAPCNGITINPTVVREHSSAVIYHGLTEVFDSTTREPLFYADHYCGLYRAVLAEGLHGMSYMSNRPFSLSVFVSDEDIAILRRRAGLES